MKGTKNPQDLVQQNTSTIKMRIQSIFLVALENLNNQQKTPHPIDGTQPLISTMWVSQYSEERR